MQKKLDFDMFDMEELLKQSSVMRKAIMEEREKKYHE